MNGGRDKGKINGKKIFRSEKKKEKKIMEEVQAAKLLTETITDDSCLRVEELNQISNNPLLWKTNPHFHRRMVCSKGKKTAARRPPCGWIIPETARRSFQGWPARPA
jgi:hypothetical protein